MMHRWDTTVPWEMIMNRVRESPAPTGMTAPEYNWLDQEYMCPDQIEFFQELLEHERDVLLSAADGTKSELREGTTTPDPSDRASIEEDHALELRIRDRERKHLHAIDQALGRIRDGSYGWCEESGDPIGIDRLLARPTATLSLEAQQRRESLGKMKQGRRHA